MASPDARLFHGLIITGRCKARFGLARRAGIEAQKPTCVICRRSYDVIELADAAHLGGAMMARHHTRRRTTRCVVWTEAGIGLTQAWTNTAALFIVREAEGKFRPVPSRRFASLTGYQP
jgi:hypothetical protein